MADLIGPFNTKYAGKCNVCRQPYEVGERIQQDPGKPTWYNEKARKEAKNYAHVSCVNAGNGMAPKPEVKPFSFDPNTKKDDGLVTLLQGFRDAIDAYLERNGDEPEVDLYEHLSREIPF